MARITKDEQGGKIILAVGLMLAYTIISVAIRLHTRWPWRKLFRREDVVLLIGTTVAICYTAPIALAVENGFGSRVAETTAATIHVPTVKRMLAVSFVLFFLVEGLGTISYGLFLFSLAEDNSGHRLALKWGCYLEAVFTMVAVIVSAIYAARLKSLSLAIWIAFSVIQAGILILLFCSISSMLLMSRMPWWKKTRAIVWFSLSLALVGAIVVRLTFTPRDIYHAGFTIDTVNLLIIMIVEMHFHIINATYPNLLVFAERATTGFTIHGAPRSASTFVAPESNGSTGTQETRGFSFSRKFKSPSSRLSPEKSHSQSRTSENEMTVSQSSESAGDVQHG